MMKKILTLGFLIAIMAILLCGCVYDQTTVNLNADGSGKVYSESGFSKDILDKLGQTANNSFGKDTPCYDFTKNGVTYNGALFEEGFESTVDFNWTGIGSISNELGPVDLVAVEGGYQLSVKLHDKFGPNMTAKHTMPSFENISDETLQGMTLEDLVAQDVPGLYLNLTVNMPYPVKQISGGTDGVTVSGKKITLNYLAMIDSGDKEWAFESLNSNNVSAFTDVPANAWYAPAVQNAFNKNMMKGFGNGTFKPNNTLTMAEVCKIVSNIGELELVNGVDYWAEFYVAYAQQFGYVLSDLEPTAKNFNVPATREQAVFAITKVLQDSNRISGNNSVNVKDVDSIDPRMKSTIQDAYKAGVVKGSPDGNFNPKSSITRAEICQILYNIQ